MDNYHKIHNLFGTLVFNDEVMHERLPKEIYKSLKKTINEGTELEPNVASVVANAMKDWAIEKGVTHFTHWFQPLNGITAEKHESFISPVSGGNVIMEFSGKELIKGEPDASSFPSGGLRVTFEARGYTSWDPTSYAFIKDGSLCIPTIFCSYKGEVLDKKTPLLRSCEVISKAAVRMLKHLGYTDISRVVPTVGPEQEYFLIDKNLYNQRKDLKLTGRTLFGVDSIKGQELEDHYFSSIKSKVMDFMQDLDKDLWSLGIPSKAKHNETAPAQYELVTIYSNVNTAVDQNQVVMERMKKIAEKHDFICLLHEKPFSGINGSGKHNNWSLVTNTGINLFDPGKQPQENLTFLVFLIAFIKAIDEYQDLLRIAAASASNDHRLGAAEAPPAIISLFLGHELENILTALKNNKVIDPKTTKYLDTKVNSLPKFKQDTTDRNRTSPLAFTGNKFEFRMVGSSASVSDINTVLNTIIANSLDEFSAEIEKGKQVKDILKNAIKSHERIIFNGNNYSNDWILEAKSRGLLNLVSSIEAYPYYIHKKNITLYSKYGILSEHEMHSRYEVLLDNYVKTIKIEANTMLDIINRDIISAVIEFKNVLLNIISNKNVQCKTEYTIYDKISNLLDFTYQTKESLESELIVVLELESISDIANHYKEKILPLMKQLRKYVDEMEKIVGSKYWPMPTYSDLLF